MGWARVVNFNEGRAQTVLLSNVILFLPPCEMLKSQLLTKRTKCVTVPHSAPLQKSKFAVPLIALFT